MSKFPESDLIEEMHDYDFAHAYLQDQANLRIAAQLKALRLQRGWTQKELADKANVKQSRISKIESGDFDSLTLASLRRIAEGFDVHLLASFTDVAAALIDLANLSAERLRAAPREESLNSLKACAQAYPAEFAVAYLADSAPRSGGVSYTIDRAQTSDSINAGFVAASI